MRTLENMFRLHLRRPLRKEKVRIVGFEEAKRNAECGEYMYYVAHGYGDRQVDIERQDVMLYLYGRHKETNPSDSPTIFLCGYDFPRTQEPGLKHIIGEDNEEMFRVNESLKDRRDRFPDSNAIEIAEAHNSVENAYALLDRKLPIKNKILYVTSKNHVRRLKYITSLLFGQLLFGQVILSENIDILGAETSADTKGNWLYETFVAMPTTWWLLRGLKDKNPDEIVKIYNQRRYHSLLKTMGRFIKSHYK